MKHKHILIADDHPLILKGLLGEFNEHGFTKVFTASNGAEALQYISDKQPEVAFLDIDMPYLTGLEVAEKARDFDTKIIILTHHKEEGFVYKIKAVGAKAYLLKEDDFSEIENVLQQLEDKHFYLSSSFNNKVLASASHKLKALQNLTSAEQKIIQLIAKHQNTLQISEVLSVSPRTIEKHRSNIILKLDLPKERDALKHFILENKLLIESL